jgi:hypothetical protein
VSLNRCVMPARGFYPGKPIKAADHRLSALGCRFFVRHLSSHAASRSSDRAHAPPRIGRDSRTTRLAAIAAGQAWRHVRQRLAPGRLAGPLVCNASHGLCAGLRGPMPWRGASVRSEDDCAASVIRVRGLIGLHILPSQRWSAARSTRSAAKRTIEQ